MKNELFYNHWKSFINNEGLEYQSQEAGSSPITELFYIPQRVKNLMTKAESLEKEIMLAYESDKLEQAENMEALYAETLQLIEDAFDEIGFEGEHRTGGEAEREGDQTLDDLMREFSELYHHYVSGIPWQSEKIDLNYLLEILRLWAKDYGWSFGGFKESTTDEQLLDAAKDSYERMKKLRHRKD